MPIRIISAVLSGKSQYLQPSYASDIDKIPHYSLGRISMYAVDLLTMSYIHNLLG
ncbi:MAG: hypothetical protein OEY31_11040 [Candidatus Bathyarchaeota archaeon]|nr:hypothetical protein [Candidatus Bathyarchaeota archaeon]